MNWREKLDSPWDQLAPHRHNQLEGGEDPTFTEVFLPRIFEILGRINGLEGFDVLDVGCGTGHLTRILSEHVGSIVGIDPSSASISIAVETARTGPDLEFQCVSIEDYAKEHSGRFDLVIAHMTLHAVEDLDEVLQGMSGVLRQDGWALYSIPHPCFWSLIKAEIGEDDFQYHLESSHVNSFRFADDRIITVPYYHRSLQTYSYDLRSNGFCLVQVDEPLPSPDTMKLYERPWIYPGFLFLLCRKLPTESNNVS